MEFIAAGVTPFLCFAYNLEFCCCLQILISKILNCFLGFPPKSNYLLVNRRVVLQCLKFVSNFCVHYSTYLPGLTYNTKCLKSKTKHLVLSCQDHIKISANRSGDCDLLIFWPSCLKIRIDKTKPNTL